MGGSRGVHKLVLAVSGASVLFTSVVAPSASAVGGGGGGGEVGTGVPGCVVLEIGTGMPCQEAAETFGLDYNQVLTSVGVVANAVEVDGVDPQDDLPVTNPISENCDIRWPEECLILTADSAQESGGGGFGTVFGFAHKGTRECRDGRNNTQAEGNVWVDGLHHRYWASPKPNSNAKWRLWTQKINAGSNSGKLRIFDQWIWSKSDARLHDFDPFSVEDASPPHQFNIGITAPNGAGFSYGYTVSGDQAGGWQRDAERVYTLWSGNSSFPKGMYSGSVWRIPKKGSGAWAINCSALAY